MRDLTEPRPVLVAIGGANLISEEDLQRSFFRRVASAFYFQKITK